MVSLPNPRLSTQYAIPEKKVDNLVNLSQIQIAIPFSVFQLFCNSPKELLKKRSLS